MAILAIEHLTTCFPDDFQGDTRVILTVPVWHGMTYTDLENELEETSNQSDYGIDDWRGWEDAKEDCFSDVLGADLVPGLKDFEVSEDYSIYAYFAIAQGDLSEDSTEKSRPHPDVPTLEEQFQLIDDAKLYDSREVCVALEVLEYVNDLALPDVESHDWAEIAHRTLYSSQGNYIRYTDLEINNPNLCRCYRHQVPCLEVVSYSDYSGDIADRANRRSLQTFLEEEGLPYWVASGRHGAVGLIVNWVALQNEEFCEMLAGIQADGYIDEQAREEVEAEAFSEGIGCYDIDVKRGFESEFEIEDFDEYTEKFYPFAYKANCLEYDLSLEIFIRYDGDFNEGNPYHCFKTGASLYIDVERFIRDIDKEDFDQILSEINEEVRLKETGTSQLALNV